MLRNVLQEYKEILTIFTPDSVIEGAVMVIVSGNRSLEIMKCDSVCYAGYDRRIEDSVSDVPSTFIPLISDRWTKHFTWRCEGPFPVQEYQKLKGIVLKAHLEGQRVRFWATDVVSLQKQINIWHELLTADVDLINTDKLEQLQQFLIVYDHINYNNAE